jgi:hypothetical protein
MNPRTKAADQRRRQADAWWSKPTASNPVTMTRAPVVRAQSTDTVGRHRAYRRSPRARPGLDTERIDDDVLRRRGAGD